MFYILYLYVEILTYVPIYDSEMSDSYTEKKNLFFFNILIQANHKNV